MWQRSTYWKSGSSATEADLASSVTDPPPPPSNDTKIKSGGGSKANKGGKVVVKKEEWDISLDMSWGNRLMEMERSESSTCPKVMCVPPQPEVTCGEVKASESYKLLVISDGNCCPIYKCAGKTTKMYLVQFGELLINTKKTC